MRQILKISYINDYIRFDDIEILKTDLEGVGKLAILRGGFWSPNLK